MLILVLLLVFAQKEQLAEDLQSLTSDPRSNNSKSRKCLELH